MTKYLLKRLLRGLFSIVVVVAVVMVLIYSLMNRDLIFQSDSLYSKKSNNDKTVHKYSRWEEYGYLDYVNYQDYLMILKSDGTITEDVFSEAAYPRNGKVTSDVKETYINQFKETYQSKGYTIVELEAVFTSSSGRKIADGGNARLFAYKDIPLITRMWKYFVNFIYVDNIHYVDEATDIGERGLTFTWFDPIYTTYNEDGSIASRKFSPAIMGNGTKHRYLLYFDSQFPYIHQNLVKINLGMSYAVTSGYDVSETMSNTQGSFLPGTVTFPSGLTEETADNLHTAKYEANSLSGNLVYADRFVDDYTNTSTMKSGLSKVGYSFIIGIISVIMAYVLGVPLGVLMALKKDKLFDKLGTFYIIFIIAVPSLAYIFLFKAIGGALGLPTTFDMDSSSKLMYILPIVSLALPSIGNLMKWIRRYMIDQMNSDYVKFARSGGLSEGEIFSKHILKNAIIPIVHGIPGAILGSLIGAIITERVYVVPGAGNLLTTAINQYDNGVIVGVTLFYAALSVVSLILGDLLMSMVDPRISFSTKSR